MAAILLAPPPTQRYFTGAATEGVSGELLYYGVQRGMGVRRASAESAMAAAA